MSRRQPFDLRTVLWITATLAAFAVTWWLLARVAPDASVAFPAQIDVEQRLAADLAALGFTNAPDPPRWQLTDVIGDRSVSERLTDLLHAEVDPTARRDRLRWAPPVALTAVVTPNDADGSALGELILRYDRAADWIGFAFDPASGAPVNAVLQPSADQAGAIARRLAGDAHIHRLEAVDPPRGALVWHYAARPPGAQIHLLYRSDGRWSGHRIVAPPHSGSSVPDEPLQTLVILLLISMIALPLAIGVWRLAQRRAGLHSLRLMLMIFVPIGVLSMADTVFVREQPGQALLNNVLSLMILLMMWIAAEAEVRESLPGALEHWDRLRAGMPVAETGRHVLIGLAGAVWLAALIVGLSLAIPVLGAFFGVAAPLGPTDLFANLPVAGTNQPIAFTLALFTGASIFLLALGHRLSRRGGWLIIPVIGALAMLPIDYEPYWMAFVIGSGLALALRFLLMRFGFLAALLACLGILSVLRLPMLPRTWQAIPGTTTLDLLLVPIALVGLTLWRRAPETRGEYALAPEYITANARSARIESEVALLGKLQLSLLPPDDFHMPGVDVAWHMQPADEVGGDFLDLLVDDDDRLWIAVADVAGHGIACASLTTAIKTAFACYAVAGVGPSTALANIRSLIGRLHRQRVMITLLLAVWDPRERTLRTVRAGHPPLILMQLAEDPSETRGTMREIGSTQPPLGARLPTSGAEDVVRVGEHGAIVLGYTDGVVEAASEAGDPFGYERWPGALPGLADFPASTVLERLLRRLEAHRGEAPQDDDITALVVKLPAAHDHGTATEDSDA
ncbi:MAG: PP2C family protein-serine/threonine phosphatase [Acidobacteriota bacterium]